MLLKSADLPMSQRLKMDINADVFVQNVKKNFPQLQILKERNMKRMSTFPH